jgi:hypothetical protein
MPATSNHPRKMVVTRSPVTTMFALMAVVAMAVACNSPASTCACHNGIDCDGRGPVASLRVSCAQEAFDERCQALRSETGYCVTQPGPIDVTLLTQWNSSNPSVAMFAAPGFLKVLGPGMVVVSAVQGLLRADSLAFMVGPGSTPERMVHLQVSVADASVVMTNKWLLGAAIDITPDRGSTQSCVSSGPIGSCDFWVFSSMIRVHASAAGYEAGDASASPPPVGLFSQYLKIGLMPVR